MLVIGSSATPKRERVYHRLGCIYAKRIKTENRIEMSVKQAENRHFCECSYCAGLKGDIRVSKKSFTQWENKHSVKFTYTPDTDTLYINTNIGLWKIFMKEDLGKYLLYHCNNYDKSMDFDTATSGAFHRQFDVKPSESMASIVEYVIAHDRAKAVIKDDYRKLPRHSKKQKKYYHQAEQKAKFQAIKRLDSIFNVLESQNPDLKYAYKESVYC